MQRQRRQISRWRTTALAAVMVWAASAYLAPVAAQDGDSIAIRLNEYKDSGVSGTATLTAAGGGTRVSMELTGDPLTGDHPTHIHTGTCDDFDPDPRYPLTTVILDEVSDEGVSDTTVEEVALDELLGADYVILVHKSAEELTNYFVCGDIKTVLPSVGVGTSRTADASPLSMALGVLAALSAAAGMGLLVTRRLHQ